MQSNKVCRIQYLCYVIEIAYGNTENNALFMIWKDMSNLMQIYFGLEVSVISAYLLIIEASKINTYVGVANELRLKCFQWHNYEGCSRYLQIIKPE